MSITRLLSNLIQLQLQVFRQSPSSFTAMENNEKNQADKKPCLLGFDDFKQEINSMLNFAMPSTSHGYESYDEQEQENSPFMGCPGVLDELVMKLNKPDAAEDEIEELFERKNQYLPGYKFSPTDGKLVTLYLTKKIAKEPIPSCFIRDDNLYQQHPKDLTESYPRHDPLVDEWYFFSPRDRKYPNGKRPNRAAGNGYWKATGADRPVEMNDETVGFKQALVFYEGKAPKGVKTNWIMHEFKGMEKRERSSKDDMKLDDYVLCRIYCKKEKSLKGKEKEEDEEEEDEEVKEEEEEEVKEEEEKAEEGQSSKNAEANQDEVYKVPYSYGADDISVTDSGYFYFPPYSDYYLPLPNWSSSD